ncbi:MAG TPA: sugar phosphate isomerase/epimerase family protein [Alloacidobacterium sp.]|nr:sugar phosphate isomerase/epimerase family protein [Alloacidobacterium sp.]
MTNRRQFLQGLSALTIAGTGASAFAQHASGIQLGAQTNAWTIDPRNFDSFLSVLDQIKQIGYAGFETGFFNLTQQFDSPEEAHRRIAATGLTFFGIHIAIPFDKDDSATKLPSAALYEKVAHGGAALGAQRLIFSGAPAANEDELKRKIEGLNAAGKFARSAGLKFAYHNHWWEFQSKIGEIDALYSQTDPKDVSFLLDAGHAYRGGANVPEFLKQHSKRIAALHLRDYKDGKQVPLGEGTFPLKEVAATLEQLRWKGWALNEEERESGAKDGTKVIEPAYQALHGAFSA